MRRNIWSGTVWMVLVTACTPLGMWVYGDPAFEVSRIQLQQEPASDSSMLVALTLWNPNDYDISTSRLELDLRVDDHTIGRFERDSVIPMTSVDSTTLDLAFTPTSGATARRLAALRPGSVHRIMVRGRATFKTPFGERKVQLAHGGAMAFGGTVDSAAKARNASNPGPNGPCAMGYRPCGRDWESSKKVE
jgi:LEA14-like dessication related protein